MTKKMLIDAAHPEEVRVAVLDNGKVEDFDFESAARKPLRGNIYLARVTRVEPSLQAAFVEYGGNRHGFLAFSEIHPDYYQIPVSDRRALQAAEAEVAELAAELELSQRGDEDDYDDDEDHHHDDDHDRRADAAAPSSQDNDADEEAADTTEPDEDEDKEKLTAAESDDASRDEDDDPVDEIEDVSREEEEEEEEDDEESDPSENIKSAKKADKNDDSAEPEDASSESDFAEDIAEDPDDAQVLDADAAAADEDGVEEAQGTAEEVEARADGGEDSDGEKEAKKKRGKSAAAKRQELFERYKDAKRKRSQLLRNYKIQEVIKRRQILLIQVVKEERGNKGAALTTYLSLAGRYCVLMPNTARGGGISRKIPHSTDRRRLRRVVDSLDVPQGMGLIIRTAGAKRTKTEIKRDYDYLLRLWENIRTLTLKSIAPCLIYEEASLIKRAIRDLYDKDISQVLVEGETGYREAKDFMKMLMPSHAKHVQPYKDKAPIFLKYGVENQLDGMYQPTVRLKSGGYIVIHQTEALVAIDVNSGRATRERNIEQTALKTNIEAAYEAARQFRLRDLAGLIVLDFIDMEEPKNNRKVEKALKDALKHDRARIQTSRISNFGLLEMSRQRRRSGIVDGTTQSCPTCAGAGVIRSSEMAALRIIRAIEGDAVTGKASILTVHASLDVAVYILNHHRDWLKRIEEEQNVTIHIIPDREKAGDDFTLEKSGAPRERSETAPVIQADQKEMIELEDDSAEDDADDQGGERKKRRRRRRRKDAARDAETKTSVSSDAESDEGDEDGKEEKSARDGDDEAPRKRRRRGRRGGRRNRRTRNDGAEASEEYLDQEASADKDDGPEDDTAEAQSSDAPSEKEDTQQATQKDSAAAESSEAGEAPKTNGASHAERPSADAEAAESEGSSTSEESASDSREEVEDLAGAPQPPTPPKPKRRGWWSRNDA